MARKLIVEILGDSRSLERSFTRSSASAQKFGRDIDTGVGRAEARFSKFQKVAAGGFVGGLIAQQAVTAIRSVIVAASESQQVLGQTRVALEAAGKSWSDYGDRIEEVIQQQSRLGFDDEALLRTFSNFVRGNKDVELSLKENALAADIARARYIDLETAAKLVQKAALGQAGALRRLGIDTEGATSGTELLALLTTKYGGAAKAASKDATTALDRAAVSTENLKEAIGSSLLPAFSKLAIAISETSDQAVTLIDKLKQLGSVKIPPIHIPFVFDSGGGQSLGSAAAGVALRGAENVPFLAPLARAIEFQVQFAAEKAADAAKEEAARQTTILANSFGQTLGDMVTNALNTAAPKVTTPADSGVKGFGSGLKPSDLFGPKITGITKALDEALLDAELSGKGIRSVRVKQRQLLINALDDPRNNREDRIKIKSALKGVKDAIAAIDADVAAGIKEANDARTDRLNKAARAAKDAAEKHKEQLRKIREHQAELAKAAKEAAQTRLQTRQFRALGLAPEGGDIIPTVANIRKQFAQLTDRLSDTGKPLGSKLAKSFEGVGKLLAGKLGPITVQTREAIKNLFATIRQTFDDESSKTSGPLTRTSSLNSNKILEGLGLDRRTEKELRARLSSFNSAGKSLAGATRPTGQFGSGIAAGGDVVVNLTTTLDGQVVAQNTTRHQIAGKRRNPWQKRGPNRGTWGF